MATVTRLKSHKKPSPRAKKPKRKTETKVSKPVAKLPPVSPKSETKVSLPLLLVNIVDADGQCDRQVEFRDPREYFIAHWREMNPDTTAVPCPEYTVDDDDSELARFAVVQLSPPRVVLRLANKAGARGFAKQWGIRHGETVIVRERIHFPTDHRLAEEALGRELTHEEEIALIDGMTESLRKPPQVEELPPLLVDISRNGKFVRTIEVDDPRKVFCEAYNSMGMGEQASPRC